MYGGYTKKAKKLVVFQIEQDEREATPHTFNIQGHHN